LIDGYIILHSSSVAVLAILNQGHALSTAGDICSLGATGPQALMPVQFTVVLYGTVIFKRTAAALTYREEYYSFLE
jgi:hypothetical protein